MGRITQWPTLFLDCPQTHSMVNILIFGPLMNTVKHQHVLCCQSQANSLFLPQSRRGMILTFFANTLQKLVHQEHNLSMASGALVTDWLFLTWDIFIKTFPVWCMIPLDISGWINLTQHSGMHTIGQTCDLTSGNPTSPHVKNANATNLEPQKHLDPYIHCQYQTNRAVVWHWISSAPYLLITGTIASFP